MMKNEISAKTRCGAAARRLRLGLAVAGAAAAVLLAAAAGAKPVISHDPVPTAVKGEPLGLRATVRDAGGRVASVSVYYASSRGMTPFRRDLSTTGAGIWFGTIPGHLIGPGSNLFYYVHADNIEGEGTDTDWYRVNVIEPGMAAADMPTVEAVAQQSQRAAATPSAVPSTAPAQQPAGGGEEASSGRNKYLLPAALIVGGAAAVGGAIALANSGGGGGGGGSSSSSVTNANYGGSYSVCFEPAGTVSNTLMYCDSGLANIYVDNGTVQIVGLWGGEILSTTTGGSAFTAEGELSARGDFPSAHLIVAGDVGGSTCSARVVGYSTDPLRPGNFTGNLSTARR